MKSWLSWLELSTLKVSSTGTKDWSVLVGASSVVSNHEGYAVEVDSARNIYVSGFTNDQLPGATSLGSTDGFLMKYDKDGVQQWLIQIGSAGADYAYGLTIDANDYLYVALQTDGTMGATNLGSTDIAVMQVNSASSIEWTEQFGTTSGEYLRGGPELAVDSAGDLFITGFTSGAFTNYTNQGGNDWFLYKVEAKSTSTSSSSTTSTVTSTGSTTSSTTSSSTTSSSTTSSTTSTSSSSTGSVTSTSTSSRSLVALVANGRGSQTGSTTW